MLPLGGTQPASALQKDKESLAQALSDCVVYCKNVSFRGFQEARSHSRPSEVSSFAEAKARKLIRDAGETEGPAAPGDQATGEGAGGFLRCRARASRQRASFPVQEKGGPVGLHPGFWLWWVSGGYWLRNRGRTPGFLGEDGDENWWVGGWVDGWMGERMDVWMDGCSDGWAAHVVGGCAGQGMTPRVALTLHP